VDNPPKNGKGPALNSEASRKLPSCPQSSPTRRIIKQSGKGKTKRRRPQWSHECKLDRVQSVRRKQIESVIRDRYGELILPDDDDGRAVLRVMLELGCDGVRAQAIAPWCASVLVEMIAAAESNFHAWATEDGGATISELVGSRVELTFDEYKRLGITHIAPCDVQRREVQAYRIERRRERNLRHRGKNPKHRQLSDRANAILHQLRYGEEFSVRELVEQNLDAFDGLDHAAARKAVLRAVRELVRHQLVETRNQVGRRELKTLYVRRPLTKDEITNAILAEDFPVITDDESDDPESERDRPARAAPAATTVQVADDE
jgi:hypothetical protein